MTSLNGWQWAILAYVAAGELASIALIGKERKPITPAMAVLTLVLNAALAFAVVMA